MDSQMKGKVVIVAGATSGMGRATCCLLAEEGAIVIANGRREDRLRELQEDCASKGEKVITVAGDITDDAVQEAAVKAAMEVNGRIDALIYSSGIALRESTLSMTRDQWNQVLNINLTGAMFMVQKVIPIMRKQHGGKIVLISSTAAKSVNLGASPSYGASKAGMVYLTRHLAAEFAKDQIYVNAVCPGPVGTEITRTWTEERKKEVASNLPLGRMGTPEEIAHTVVFLASPLSDYMTGESVMQNGGRYMDA